MSSTTTPKFALDPRQRPFCRADARHAGIPLARLLGPSSNPRIFDLSIFYDRYVSSIVVTNEMRELRTVELSPAGSFVSHHSAAEIWVVSYLSRHRPTSA